MRGPGADLLLLCDQPRVGGEGDTDGRKGFCLTSPSACVTVNISTAVIGLAVIVSLVLGPGPTDGQGGRVARVGAREPVRDPRILLIIFID